MENTNQSSFLKSTMNYGAMLGLALVIYSVILWMFGLTFSKPLGYLSYLLIIAGLYLGIRAFRDQESGGFISYGRALGVGTMIGLFAGVITGFFTFIMFKFMDPELVDKAILMAEEALYKRGMTEDQIEMAIKAQKMFMKPVIFAISSILGSVFMSFIFSLIISIFLKKEESPFKEA